MSFFIQSEINTINILDYVCPKIIFRKLWHVPLEFLFLFLEWELIGKNKIDERERESQLIGKNKIGLNPWPLKQDRNAPTMRQSTRIGLDKKCKCIFIMPTVCLKEINVINTPSNGREINFTYKWTYEGSSVRFSTFFNLK